MRPSCSWTPLSIGKVLILSPFSFFALDSHKQTQKQAQDNNIFIYNNGLKWAKEKWRKHKICAQVSKGKINMNNEQEINDFKSKWQEIKCSN